jgi:hypothetical protein
MRITPRIGTSVRTPLGPIYLGASIRPGQRSTPRARITPGPMVRPVRVATPKPVANPRMTFARPTPTPQPVRPMVVQVAITHPREAAYRLVALAMLLGTAVSLVAMLFGAMAMGIIQAPAQHSATPLVSVVSSGAWHEASHPLIPRR